MAIDQAALNALSAALVKYYGEELYNIGVETRLYVGDKVDAAQAAAIATSKTYTDEELAKITNVHPDVLDVLAQIQAMLDADTGTAEFDTSTNIITRLRDLSDAVIAAQTKADLATTSAETNAANIAAAVASLSAEISIAKSAAAAAQATADAAASTAASAQSTADAASTAADAAQADVNTLHSVLSQYFTAAADLHRNFAEGLHGAPSTDGHATTAPLTVAGGSSGGVSDGGVI